MNTGIMLIEKSARQSIWVIKEHYPIYAIRKNLYAYDFAVIFIREKVGNTHRYCNNMENVHISIACERSNKEYHMLVKDMALDKTIAAEEVDSVFIYFEKSTQALLAFTTAETFPDTGFFMNTVSGEDVPSLREEAMSIAYMLDSTRSLFRMFHQYNNTERRSDINEYSK